MIHYWSLYTDILMLDITSLLTTVSNYNLVGLSDLGIIHFLYAN